VAESHPGPLRPKLFGSPVIGWVLSGNGVRCNPQIVGGYLLDPLPQRLHIGLSARHPATPIHPWQLLYLSTCLGWWTGPQLPMEDWGRPT